jgi:hypothetical protein
MLVPVNRVLRPKLLILGAFVVGLVALLTFAMNRQVTVTSPPASSEERPSQPPRPALTAAEEQYIRALWPIHGDVERSTMRMSLGQIFYKTQDLDRAELNARVKEALATYRAAENQLRGLDAPASLRSEHEEYLAAIRLFQECAVELLKMFTDGREDHMLAAYPKSQEGSNKIREVGGKFWPHEFPPH